VKFGLREFRNGLCWGSGSSEAGSILHSWEVPGGVQHFTLEELKKATKGFGRANEIGEGGFGKVFVGTFPGGRTLAIKRAGPENSSGQFRNEVTNRYYLF